MRGNEIHNFQELLGYAVSLPTKTVAVVNPNNNETFSAIAEAATSLKTRFMLFGNRTQISEGIASYSGLESAIEIGDCNEVSCALKAAIASVLDGQADLLMKGGVDTATMMKAVLNEGSGLKTGRLLSDIFVLEYPPRPDNQFVMITDGGMTLSPDLKNKVELVINAVEVAHALGNENPKVAILSATEFVLPNLQSTIDAAALSKMNERGQIKGCIVDGPFALDNALSPEAADEKGIRSAVAGRAEILVAANIESANSLAKSTTYFASLRLAHVIVGAKVPILIPSRSDKSDAKLLSVALGSIVSEYLKRG
ncbi:MAG: bifunctional enoyl-CoA hydratase/phosphate acetyltransferase [Bacteroidetes bacterium]|nr:bifunctional enoyl-CoA hydratase/phosphate acetyltransferase [Bacteroidota bacterium]